MISDVAVRSILYGKYKAKLDRLPISTGYSNRYLGAATSNDNEFGVRRAAWSGLSACARAIPIEM